MLGTWALPPGPAALAEGTKTLLGRVVTFLLLFGVEPCRRGDLLSPVPSAAVDQAATQSCEMRRESSVNTTPMAYRPELGLPAALSSVT